MRTPRRIALIVYDGVATFELGIACDVFAGDPVEPDGIPRYEVLICGANDACVVSDMGFRIQPLFDLEVLDDVETVIVPPTTEIDRVPAEVFLALRRAHERGSRIISLCTGAFILARSGLLDHRRATTHWSECADLAAAHPTVSVDPDVLFVEDGNILTSAGSAAAIDLCLHVVRQDYGSDAALRLARELVVPPQRDGGQAQFIEAPLVNLESPDLLAETLSWARDHLSETLTVGTLAARSAMSPRTFARRFRAVTGTTPHQWLQHQRVQLARQLLERSNLSVEEVAQRSGLSSGANLRKHFGRTVRTSPQTYRRTFQAR
jgi:transcriptional regulator GlxA family with amidase domain